MNKIVLKGVLRKIEFSHFIGDVEYNKASLITKDGDIVDIKFKKFSNKYKEGDEIELVGNVRSYSHKTEDGKNRVELYVFTYFDLPESGAFEEESCNKLIIDGKICKMDKLRENSSGKQSLHFILANNIDNSKNSDTNKVLNSYLPCISFGNKAKDIFNNYNVGSTIQIIGAFHSREYKKYTGSGEFEIKVAHELLIEDIKAI